MVKRKAVLTLAAVLAASGIVAAEARTSPAFAGGEVDLGYYEQVPTIAANDPLSKDKMTRWSFALRRDDAYLQSLHDTAKDPAAALKLDFSYGVVMTEAESTELGTRTRIGQTDVPKVRAYFAALPDVFGGLWLDHVAGGKLAVAVTRDADVHASALRPLLAYPERLDVRTVPYTLAELKATKQQARELRAEARQRGIDANSIGYREDAGAVTIGVPAAQLDDARAFFAERLAGARYAVHAGAVSLAGDSGNNGPPWKGATRITTHTTPTSYTCQTGFTVFRWINAVRYYYLLTAGHCSLDGWQIRQPGEPYFIGSTGARCFANGCAADAILINELQTAKSDLVVKTPGGNNFRVKSEQAQGADYVGQNSCISVSQSTAGARNTWYCGSLLETSRETVVWDPIGPNGWVTFDFGRVISAPATTYKGDSGGPVFNGLEPSINNPTALGIIHGFEEGTHRTVYHHIYDALQAVSAAGVARTG